MIYSKVLIFGGTGSLGTTIINDWIGIADNFYVYSRDEYKQWLLKQKFHVHFILGDINDYNKIEDTLLKVNPTLIIVASALKHIDKCQENVKECLNTNVNGLLNILNATRKIYNIKKLDLQKIIFVSTDKACEPITIYGMSKGISEHIIQTTEPIPGVKLLAVRYGNVINSNGSIIPVFKNQIKSDCLYVTHPEMTRFYMTLEQSVQLIKDAVDYGENREIWIPKLKSMKIMDLAILFAKKYNKEIKLTGLRCREKIHEKLISDEEFKRTVIKEGEYEDRYVITNEMVKSPLNFKYESNENLLNIEELQEKLIDYL